LAVEGVATVISIGPTDRRFESLLDAAPGEIRCLPRSTAGIEELSALLRRAALVISNSTGPLHVAAALETPTLGFYPPWRSCSVARWGPYAANGWGLVAGSGDAERWSRGRRRREGQHLMGQISVAAAVTCALGLLRGDTPRL
jgi:ADP-heptose:LPS heptosyltransferase